MHVFVNILCLLILRLWQFIFNGTLFYKPYIQDAEITCNDTPPTDLFSVGIFIDHAMLWYLPGGCYHCNFKYDSTWMFVFLNH